MTCLRIWNLRRGDDDDNRSSPYGGGFRSLVIPTLLEFNYLKAPLAFLALVIGPAILVGIAPSVVVTYWRLAYHTLTLAGTNLTVALGLFVLLLGTALWIARPLLQKAFVDFRHLHYALVFPIFVAFRELLRTVTERLAGRSITPEQLGRSRRLGTIVAALLFAGGGLALASLAEFTIGLKLINVERVRFWPAFTATMGNAAIILGLSTALESLHWLWREVSLSGPALDWVPNPAPAGGPILRIAHLSDLHLVGERYGCRMETGTRGPRGNRCFRNALRKLAAIHASTPLDCVLVTGDVTDAGTRGEWTQFLDHLRAFPGMQERLSFVPGNHDVNIVDRANPGRMDLPWSAGQALRKLRFILALDDVQGHRTYLVDRASGALGPTLRDYLREGRRLDQLRALAQRGAMRGRWEMAKTWEAIFPLVEAPKTEEGYGLILLDSNAPSHFSLTNAIGLVSPSQMKALKSLLKNFPRRAWIILLHHQVVEYPVASISLRDRIGLALVNAPDVLAAVAPHASRVLVLHGHRHTDWIGTCGPVVLCSAPSVALGSDKEKEHGWFHVHEVALGADGGIRLIATERVKVA
ncbi:MAG TPA: metallophosphoesterase [Candidatus Angelobacter sp.]|nr:metallophosphoesterase [Candidatus Angelobacter sp.]